MACCWSQLNRGCQEPASGLGGFYYSAAAFEAPGDREGKTGLIQAGWSAKQHPKFRPTQEFSEPLQPWDPRSG